ncbi:ATP-binding cassette domain-containing protein [Rugosimonospora acidiphila]|uniref:ATP-binding cassette domain-containing protein n=1 Tax=Rugosimonospora acidiphila TaxID=556531 RepID=A0ABP9SD37_9ACTN
MTHGQFLLEVRDLVVHYGHGRRRAPTTAVDEVSLCIAAGQTVALVGASGSGKSTVGNAVLGLTPAASGTVTFAGEDITHAPPGRRRALTRDIQAVFQDPYGSLNPSRTIRQTLVEPLLAHRGVEPVPARAAVSEALRSVGLTEDVADRYPAEFSGGQRQRVAIARALMVRPRLIVCDEPTSALDLSIQAQVLNLLRQLQRDRGVSYLFITHDLAIVRHIAHRIVVLRRGRVVETGTTGQVCEAPEHPYTRALLAAAPVPDPVAQRARREAYEAAAVQR